MTWSPCPRPRSAPPLRPTTASQTRAPASITTSAITPTCTTCRYFPLFGLFANVALVFSGQFVRYVSSLHATLPAGVDAWGVALKLLMSSVVALGAVVAGCYRYLNVAVIEPQEAAAKAAGEARAGGGGLKLKTKKKASMTSAPLRGAGEE